MNARAVVPAAAASVLVLAAAVLYATGHREQYIVLTSLLGASPFRFPFLDTHGELAVVECHRLGIDVYSLNPCDVFGRIHVYSPLWFGLSVFPLDTSWTPAVGLAIVALFLLSLPLLPPGRGAWQVGIIALASVSATVAFALERGNADLLIFVFAALIVRLMSRRLWLRAIGYAIAVLAALLKFYPAVLLATAVRERLTAFVCVCVAATAVIACYVALEFHDLMRAIAAIPATHCFDVNIIGAHDLPCGLAQTFGWPDAAARFLSAALAVAVAAFAAWLNLRSDLPARIASLTDLEATSLLAGSALIVFCFFNAQNVLYRGIFLLFAMPGLTVLAWPGTDRRASRLWLSAVVLMLLLLNWHTVGRLAGYSFVRDSAGVRVEGAASLGVWFAHEVGWWLAVALMAALLLAMLLRSPAWRDLRAAAPHLSLSFGSSTSRSASPNRLTPNTVSAIASPGNTAIQGAVEAYSSAPPCSISPQAGVGSCTPRPR